MTPRVTIIETRGIKHQIEFVSIRTTTYRTSSSPRGFTVQSRTKLTINWPPKDRLLEYAAGRFQRIDRGYVWFNPHLTLRGVWFGEEFINVKATNPNSEKWRPRNPTSPHWYDELRLQRYLAAHVARDRDLGQHRTVRHS